MTQDNRDKFLYLAGRYGQKIKFYNVEEFCEDKINEIKKLRPEINKTSFSIAMCYRLFIPQILPPSIEKAIYLDADIIVNLNLNELWQINVDNVPVGVVPISTQFGIQHIKNHFTLCTDELTKPEEYFNSGVLLMNLNDLRSEERLVADGIKFIASRPQYKFLDQDILNYCFATRALKLPAKFNRYTGIARYIKEPISKKIYHYNSNDFSLNTKEPLYRLWVSHFIRTPWFDIETFGRLYDSFLNVRNSIKGATASVSSCVSGKTRAFFVEPAKIDPMKKYFSIHDNELIIPAENENSLQNLIEAMKSSQGKIIVFIMTPNFLNKSFPFDLLTKEGFVSGKDFLRGWEHLSEAYGGKFYACQLIQAM